MPILYIFSMPYIEIEMFRMNGKVVKLKKSIRIVFITQRLDFLQQFKNGI